MNTTGMINLGGVTSRAEMSRLTDLTENQSATILVIDELFKSFIKQIYRATTNEYSNYQSVCQLFSGFIDLFTKYKKIGQVESFKWVVLSSQQSKSPRYSVSLL